MLKKVEHVKSILENDDSKASLLDSTKKSPLHAAAFNGTPEIAGIFYYNCNGGGKSPYSLSKRTSLLIKVHFIFHRINHHYWWL